MEAIEQAKHLFDVVLLDVRLPDGSGVEVYEAMGSIAPHLQKQTAFLVGERVEGEILAFLRKTGAQYVPKPFPLPKVIAAVSSLARQIKKPQDKRRGAVVQPRKSS
ncbi:MAG TPA: response regulator [Chromatiales bacterium]|nr:response regulator [Chromatiales bacterium]